MNEKHTGIEWFNLNLKPLLGNDFELKFVNEEGGDLGDLAGVQFDSEQKGGYIYFWSSGYIGFQLVDYVSEIELVDDTTEEVGSRSYDEVFKDLVLKLK
jgi:hypothetical protein